MKIRVKFQLSKKYADVDLFLRRTLILLSVGVSLFTSSFGFAHSDAGSHSTSFAAEAVISNLIHFISEGREVRPLNLNDSYPFDLVIAAKSESLSQILQFGVLSVFETAESNANGDFPKRLAASRTHSRLLNLDISIPDLLPKSGYLAVGGVGEYERFQEHYGEMLIVLREPMRRQTIYAYQDTLSTSVSFPLGFGKFKTLGPKDALSAGNYVMDYMEILVWGPIQPSDIKEIYLPENTIKRIPLRVLRQIKGARIQLFSYVPNRIHESKFSISEPKPFEIPGKPIPVKKWSFAELRVRFENSDNVSLKYLLLIQMARFATLEAEEFFKTELLKALPKYRRMTLEALMKSVSVDDGALIPMGLKIALKRPKSLQKFLSSFDHIGVQTCSKVLNAM